MIMGSTPAPECQRDGLEQMEAAVNNLIHEKMGLTGPRMGFQITRATSWGLGFSREVKKTRAGGGGDLLVIPYRNPEAVGSRL